jgi:cyanophycinase
MSPNALDTDRRLSVPGPIALVGSGEYTPAMDDTDRYLLSLIGGAAEARVALLPTASGLEPGRPAYWNTLGLDHFRALGVQDLRPLDLLDAGDTRDLAKIEPLRDATFFYFSGGDPVHLVQSFRGSPAWELILAAHQRGAVLAGCSAGAMALGSFTASPRRAFNGGQIAWQDALGIVPRIATLPHFDRMRAAWPDTLQALRQASAQDLTILGIDEDTALTSPGGGSARWRVSGRQTVTVSRGAGPDHVYHPGDELDL